MTDPLTEALALAAEGFYIFPLHIARVVDDKGTVLCTCGKSGNIADKDTCKGKHPRPGIRPSEDATTDPTIIRAWWSKWENAAIGVHLGRSHCWGLDIDPRHGGDVSLQKMIEKYGDLPETRVVKTGGDGLHYYFAAWTEKIHNAQLPDYPGIDIKGSDGTAYLVAPPSAHVSGQSYEYLNRMPPMDAPDWLLELVKGGKVVNQKGSPSVNLRKASREVHIHKLLTPAQLSLLHNEGDKLIGAHPVHGSTTGRNFTINLTTNRWYCFRHQTGGDLFALAAVLTGLCACEVFKKGGKNPLSGKNWKGAVKAALELGIPVGELETHMKVYKRGAV